MKNFTRETAEGNFSLWSISNKKNLDEPGEFENAAASGRYSCVLQIADAW
jgi:hypothetical protein